MYELNLLNYKFPSLEGLYNTEGSSFHLTEVLYNVSYTTIYIYIYIYIPYFSTGNARYLYKKGLNL